MNLLSEDAMAQGMVLASLVGGIALACIAQLVSAFPRRDSAQNDRPVNTAVVCLAVAATVMMINVWSGIIFFIDDGEDRAAIARVFYGGLLLGVVFFALGMAETVAIRSPRLRWPMVILFGSLLIAEAVLARAYLL